VAQLWLAHALAALAGNQRKYQEEQGHDEHSSFWEVLKWPRKTGDAQAGGAKSQAEREMARELAQYRAENERLRIMLKNPPHPAQEEWEYSNREDAMEQIKSDKMVMTFLHSRVGDLERQLASEREQSLSATKKAATVKAENEVLKKRLAELDAQLVEVNSSSASKGESGSNLNAVIHEKDRQLQAFKQACAQLKVKKGILVNEVKKLQAEVARLGQENDRQRLDLQHLRLQEESFFKASSREEYQIASLLLEIDELRRSLDESSIERINVQLIRQRKKAYEESCKKQEEEKERNEEEEEAGNLGQEIAQMKSADKNEEGHDGSEHAQSDEEKKNGMPSPSELIEMSNQRLEEFHSEILLRKGKLAAPSDTANKESNADEGPVAKLLAAERCQKQEIKERCLDLLADICNLRIQVNAYSERLIAHAKHEEHMFVWIE